VRLLSRYLLRQLAAPFLFGLGALTSLMLLSQIAKKFGALVGKGLPWRVIGEVFALSLPFIIAMTLPMAVLLAVLYAFSHLAADNEITAMRASGISVYQILARSWRGASSCRRSISPSSTRCCPGATPGFGGC
jgi:lipopolysaccharide export system permease protein